jgi:AcrR family transcriptional regulator
MPIKEKPAKRKRVTKLAHERLEDLLQASLAVFSKNGISASTVEQVTKYADVSKGTFYHYFESKDHAVGLLWERYLEGFVKESEKILNDDSKNYSTRLTEAFYQLTVYVLKHADLHRLVYRTADSHALELCRVQNQKIIDLIADAVKRGVDEGELSCRSPDLLVSILFHGICRALHDEMMDEQSLDEETLLNTSKQLAETAFRPKTGP